MEVIYGLIPGMLILGLVAVGVLFWAARSGQFDDLDGDAHRILMDDDATDRRRFPDADEEPPATETSQGLSPDNRSKASRSRKGE